MLASLVKASTIQTKIARLTFNNVNKRNALSRAMLQELQTHLKAIESSQDIRVVVIDANGPVFSSGHDLKELQQNTTHENTSLMSLCSSVMHKIATLNKPVIAQVGGMATAAGCQLVASCDLAYASKEARFATPGVNIGLFCSTPGVALGRCVHRKHAMSMLLTGEAISANEAERIGLINAVIDSKDKLDEEVLKVASKIASKSSLAIELGKPLFYKQLEMPLEDAYQVASDTMVENMECDEAKEGVDAFLTKRKPDWSTTKD